MTLRKSRLDYKWVILATCFFMEFLCLGFCSSNVGLYTKAVTEALHIKRSLYSLAHSLRFIVQVITALNFGAMVHKLGIKKMVGIGMMSLTGSVLIRAYAANIVHLYVGSALWGMGIVMVGSTMAGTIVRRWFHKDVGRYTGLVMSANGIGGAIAAQIISPIINNGEVFGYRKAYLLSAAIAFAITVLVMIFLREHPADGPVIQETTGKKKEPKGSVWKGLPYEVLRKKPYFYATAVLVFLTGISIQSIGSITLVYMGDLGIPADFIATTATVGSLCLTFGKLIVGTVYDKKGLRFTLLMCQSAGILAFLLKALMNNSTLGMVFAMAAAVIVTVSSPMETVLMPLLTGDLFGMAAYHKVLGIFTAMNSLGLCLGSPLGDLYYDLFGTYKPCFWFFTVLLFGVAVAYRFVIRAAYKDKEALCLETA